MKDLGFSSDFLLHSQLAQESSSGFFGDEVECSGILSPFFYLDQF